MSQKVPQHIAIVMDGNGRWAQSKGLQRVQGHQAGVESVKRIIQCCVERGVSELSLFAFSSENWSRPAHEVDFLMKLFVEALENELQTLHKNDIHVKFIGERARLSPIIQKLMAFSESLKIEKPKLTVNVAVNYGGKWDIVQATQSIAQKVLDGEITVKNINEKLFSQHLSTGDSVAPDLLIRTSGEKRISNFFLWQFAYTEIYFCDAYWPDFGADQFDEALACYAARERRFGNISFSQAEDEMHV